MIPCRTVARVWGKALTRDNVGVPVYIYRLKAKSHNTIHERVQYIYTPNTYANTYHAISFSSS
jgi:hypothetical protein